MEMLLNILKTLIYSYFMCGFVCTIVFIVINICENYRRFGSANVLHTASRAPIVLGVWPVFLTLLVAILRRR